MGDGTSGDSQDPGFDLFDRWLAHREETATTDEPTAAESTDAESAEEPAAQEPAAQEPAAQEPAAQEPAAEEPAAVPSPDPLFDESFPTDESEPTLEEPDLELPLELVAPAPRESPAASEEPEPAAPAPAVTGPPDERSRADLSNDLSRSILDALATPTPVERTPGPNPVSPEAFEPVIIPSARKKAEPRRGLLSGRRKKSGAEPLDQPLDQLLPEPDQATEATDLVDATEEARSAELDRIAAAQAEREAELLRQAQAADAAQADQAAQAEADRIAAEEATRAAEAARQAELDRIAAAQAEREAELLRQAQAAEAAQAEADRIAAEEATRAAEAARHAELDRIAAAQAEREAELLRQAQAAEADRIAAEEAQRAARAARAAREEIAAAAAAAAAEVAGEAEQPPGPAAPDTTGRVDQVDAGREVFAAFAAAGAEAPVTPSPEGEPEPEPQKHRRLGHRLSGAGPTAPATPATPATPAARPAARPDGLSQPDAIRALLAERAASGETRAEPAPGRVGRDAPAASRSTPNADPGAEAARVGRSTNVDFSPRTGTRRLVNVLLLLTLGAAALAAYVAYEDRSEVNIGIAATLGVLMLVIWAVRAGSDTARLSVKSGQLEVVRGGGRFVFDLTSRYTPIEVVGEPGKRGWKVLFLRRSMAPFVVDASMVDPEEFMRVLRQHRPEHD